MFYEAAENQKMVCFSKSYFTGTNSTEEGSVDQVAQAYCESHFDHDRRKIDSISEEI